VRSIRSIALVESVENGPCWVRFVRFVYDPGYVTLQMFSLRTLGETATGRQPRRPGVRSVTVWLYLLVELCNDIGRFVI
jgi:hypothetical protein